MSGVEYRVHHAEKLNVRTGNLRETCQQNLLKNSEANHVFKALDLDNSLIPCIHDVVAVGLALACISSMSRRCRAGASPSAPARPAR